MKGFEHPACCRDQTSDAEDVATPIQVSDSLATLQEVILQHGDPGRILECYYWSKEPGLLECLRALLDAPVDVRAALQAFFVSAVARKSITATIEANGTLSLYSPEAATILTQLFRSNIVPTHRC